jgi:hypothetical protein
VSEVVPSPSVSLHVSAQIDRSSFSSAMEDTNLEVLVVVEVVSVVVLLKNVVSLVIF